MNFEDNYRKQSKKTLWGEELDSESLFDRLNKEYVNNLTPSFDLHSIVPLNKFIMMHWMNRMNHCR
jgi:hypothetical protein